MSELDILNHIPSEWSNAPELPFAYQDEENVITDSSVVKWWQDLNASKEILQIYKEIAGLQRPLSIQELIEYYHKLRFLSKTDTLRGLSAISKDINTNFNPRTTLLYLKDGSSKFIYQYYANQLPKFGTTRLDGSGLVISRNGDFANNIRPQDAGNLLFVDDWILSGDQFAGDITSIAKSEKQLFTYHLVMSDAGRDIYKKDGFNGKCVYRINEEKPNPLLGGYSLYGFHKVPDNLPSLFAGSKAHDSLDYSIFPNINGEQIGRNSRLVKY